MKNEVVKLREKMLEESIDCYVVPTSDAHNSEYVGEHDTIRKWLTGFTGSNGTILVTKDEALLWTDGRYFIQCENELAGSGISMMKMGEKDVPTLWEYIIKLSKENGTSEKKYNVGFDGRVLNIKAVKELMEKDTDKLISLQVTCDLAGDLWDESGDRPARSCERIRTLDLAFAGVEVLDKIEQVRDEMEKHNCSQYFLSKLDDIMWLFNLRGNDVVCNPVALSYAFITMQEAFIFIQEEAITPAVRAYLNNNRIIICNYDEVFDFLSDYPFEGKTLLDDSEVSFRAFSSICNSLSIENDVLAQNDAFVYAMNPTCMLKAIKNETEIKHMREYFLRDSASTTKYICWLKKKAAGMLKGEDTLNEYEASKKCDELRLETEGCYELSFDTIAAYGPNAAMMHYEATKDSYAECKPKGMLLTDCGGQYPAATTDVTRTIALGPVSEEEKHDFTLVIKGWLALMNAMWLEGCSGRNLDILARGPVWREGKDYKCGTGHGVGCNLNVHEGPQNIRWKYLSGHNDAELKIGMTVTDEPGVYIEGKYGIRTENTLLVEDRGTTPDGHFLGFENLTWVPIDMELVDLSMLERSELEALRTYQKETATKLEGRLFDEEMEWVKKQADF